MITAGQNYLTYESRLNPAAEFPSELDVKFEAAWAKSLRRRFLWYCATTIITSVPAILFFVAVIVIPLVDFNIDRIVFLILEMLLSLGLYIGAWWYAFRLPPNRKAILRLAFWLYVIASTLSLMSARLQPPQLAQVRPAKRGTAATVPAMPTTQQGLADNFAAGFKVGFSAAPTSPKPRAVASPATMFAVGSPFGIFFSHLIICLFMPWNFRQSIRPAIFILAVASCISVIDLALHKIGWLSLVSPIMVVAAFVPGSVWCWWRFSRFRKRFTLYYQSSAYQQLQTELGNARRIHESQFPAPRSAGSIRFNYAYEPMRQIGGDLLFAFPAADVVTDRLTTVVFDVTGHGVAAALFVNRLVGELERCFGQHPGASPDDVLAAMNSHVFYTLARHSMFVTAFVAQVDRELGTLTYASAGHPSAFVLNNQGNLKELESTCCMLGVIEPAQFSGEQVSIDFSAGDAVVMCTDGAIEAREVESREQLGTQRLGQLVASQDRSAMHDWPRLLLGKIASYRQTAPDDDTLIVTLFRSTEPS